MDWMSPEANSLQFLVELDLVVKRSFELLLLFLCRIRGTLGEESAREGERERKRGEGGKVTFNGAAQLRSNLSRRTFSLSPVCDPYQPPRVALL